MSIADNLMIDAIGIPEYFVTEVGRIEEAGGGCMRVYNCIRRAGQLVPVFTVIIPKDSLIVAGTAVAAAARGPASGVREIRDRLEMIAH